MTGLRKEDVWKAYEGDNYQCIDTGIESNLCYIFFSSNGLYFPDEKEVFEKVIIQYDRYEWKWVVSQSGLARQVGRIIYMRDVFKDWYSRGISKTVNSIDKILDLLKDLTTGYQIITVGSSAGGYMAVLTAVRLQALWCFNFSGQYKVEVEMQEEYKDLSVLLKNYKGIIFYFVPLRSRQDLEQYAFIRDMVCVKTFCFTGRKHADTLLTGNMPYIVNKDKKELMKLYDHYAGKKINKVEFLFYSVPVKDIVYIVPKELKGFIGRRIGRQDCDV